MAEERKRIAELLWSDEKILTEDLYAILGQALGQMQSWVAAWEVVGIAIRALNDPVRLQKLARMIVSDETQHPAVKLYEVFPELVDLESAEAAYKQRYVRPVDTDEFELPEA